MALRSFNSGPNDVTSQYSKSFLENITAYLDYILEVMLPYYIVF